MSDVNEQLERLIVRSLDGALSEDDELALNRELIRNPEARRLMTAYRAVDEWSIAALENVAAGTPPSFDALAWTRAGSSGQPTGRGRRWFWLAPGAIAAALLAMVVSRSGPTNVQPVPLTRTQSAQTFRGVPGSPFMDGQEDLMRTVRSTPAIHRNTGRDIIGVVGDDGNLYWIEVERTRTVTLPAGGSSRAGALSTL